MMGRNYLKCHQTKMKLLSRVEDVMGKLNRPKVVCYDSWIFEKCRLLKIVGRCFGRNETNFFEVIFSFLKPINVHCIRDLILTSPPQVKVV